ncbi:hypothetical protein E2542_SST19051 [Spatholobus suberectus]|nr:hypothetical protein E2542_SST19051 [Spatholobus suberectus]
MTLKLRASKHRKVEIGHKPLKAMVQLFEADFVFQKTQTLARLTERVSEEDRAEAAPPSVLPAPSKLASKRVSKRGVAPPQLDLPSASTSQRISIANHRHTGVARHDSPLRLRCALTRTTSNTPQRREALTNGAPSRTTIKAPNPQSHHRCISLFPSQSSISRRCRGVNTTQPPRYDPPSTALFPPDVAPLSSVCSVFPRASRNLCNGVARGISLGFSNRVLGEKPIRPTCSPNPSCK